LGGWSHTYEGTSECCKGAENPPGSAAWSQTHVYHPEEFWVTCFQAPVPNNTIPPDGYCLLPEEKHPGTKAGIHDTYYCEIEGQKL